MPHEEGPVRLPDANPSAALRSCHSVYDCYGSFTPFLPSRHVRLAPKSGHAASAAFMSKALDEGEFTEGHELPGKWRVPKAMIGRRLSQAEAKKLLAKLE